MSHPDQETGCRFVEWLCLLEPSNVEEHGDHTLIRHASGDVSTLWKCTKGSALPKSLGPLQDFYSQFDGADLFSSAFKIASIRGGKVVRGVRVVGSLSDLRQEAEAAVVRCPEEGTPFMVGSGQWLYTVGRSSGAIYEWDLEYSELSTDTYTSLQEIVQECSE